MSSIQYTAYFTSPPEAVFPYLEDSDKIKQWMTGVERDEATSDGPTRVGSTFEMDIKEGRKLTTYQGEVTKYEPNRLMGVKLVGGCGKTPMTMFADYELTRTESGGTKLDYECRCELPSGFLFKLLGPLFKFMGKAMIKKFMRNLKRLVDTPAGGQQAAAG